MFENFEWASALPYIAFITVILTVVIGVLGLRQGYYRNRRLTPRGRHMVLALVALGLVTLLSGIADQRISRAQEERDTASRIAQFNRQMASLETMTGNLTAVQRSLQDSVRRQEQTAQAANQNLRMSRELQAQYQENTRNILSRLVDETNRISMSEVRAPVSLLWCSGQDENFSNPLPSYVGIRVNGRRGEFNIYSGTTESELFGATFHNFQNHLGGYDTFPAWRGALVSVQIFALTRERRALEESGQAQQIEGDSPGLDGSHTPGACNGIMTLILNGRSMLMTAVTLRETKRGRFEGRVDNVRVSGEALPNFSF